VKTFRALQPDVVLAEYGPIAASIVDACREARVPLVAHFHGYDAHRRDVVSRQMNAYRHLFTHAAAVVAVSRVMVRQLVELGCAANKIAYNPCGVDASMFAGAAPEASAPVLLSTGRMVDKKAPHLMLFALARALAYVPDVRLRMIGDGDLLGICRDIAANLGIEHAVTFLGVQPHEQVQAEMRAARAFLQHSVTAADGDMEGTPVAVLEAGAAGLPVISTRHAGIADVVVDGVTGLLTEERDVEGTAAGIATLMRDPMRAAELGRNAADRVRRYYTHDHSIRRLTLVLETAASGASVEETRARLEQDLPPADGPRPDAPSLVTANNGAKP
jgi:glycosyltransferase involved in cell wall biosynthesis